MGNCAPEKNIGDGPGSPLAENEFRFGEFSYKKFEAEFEKAYPASKCLTKAQIEQALKGKPSFQNDLGTYTGDIDSAGKRHGFGMFKWKDNSTYIGNWVNDKAYGHGRMNHKDGDYYEGMWKDDKAEGYGTFMRKDEAVFQGEWVQDKQHGKGIERMRNGLRYAGIYFEGKKHGKGILTLPDGSSFEVDHLHPRVTSSRTRSTASVS